MKLPTWLRITAALAAGACISLAPAILNGEWNRALGGLAVVAIATAFGWGGYRIGFANAQAIQAYREELDREPDHQGLGPKDLAMDLRVHGDPTVYQTSDTEPGVTP